MNANRKTAIAVGILYIIGTVVGILSGVVSTPLLEAPVDLAQVFESHSQVIVGALLVLTMGISLSLVPVLMYPVLRRHNPALAIGYVVYRGGLETVTYIGLVVGWLALLALGPSYAQAGTADAGTFAVLSSAILGTQDAIGHLVTIVFIVGAVMFYSALYRYRLVPRWLSGWGLVAAVPYVVSGILALFGVLAPMTPVETAMVLPLALQEMVMAIWLIVKGFNPAATGSPTARV